MDQKPIGEQQRAVVTATREPGTDSNGLPAGLSAISKAAYSRRRFLALATKVGAAIAVVPGAVVGLDVKNAKAGTPGTCIPGTNVKTSSGCDYVNGCIGRCDNHESYCFFGPGSEDYFVCINPFYNYTDAKAACACHHYHAYCCCAYC